VDERVFERCVNSLFQQYLGRPVEPEAQRRYIAALRHGEPYSHIESQIKNSPEGERRRVLVSQWRGLEQSKDNPSDGEFILNVLELFFEGDGIDPREIEYWKGILREDPEIRATFIKDLVTARIALRSQESKPSHDPHSLRIMGTDLPITIADWRDKASKSGLKKPRVPRPGLGKPFEHSGNVVVSAITSLYKGRRFIEEFLENIAAQSIFDQSELIIIDADSPEGEADIILEYQKLYPNIIYKRINYRIGIYEAWNLGVQIARGKYLTNTNVDDLRRSDSFELQAKTLDQHSFADVVYQDFFYSFDASFSFDEVAMIDFRSKLPLVTPNTLLAFNPPHNAPMWRKSLHADVGQFDDSFRSAADHEFWLRCLSKGKCFFKINTPHIVYFINPEGISTRPNTRGVDEGRLILKQYCRKLISRHLTMSRREFAETLGIAPDWSWDKPLYEVVQDQLKRLGEQRKAGFSSAMSNSHPPGSDS
jgi:glycosyltransferase involved in cell wall biosynthesis